MKAGKEDTKCLSEKVQLYGCQRVSDSVMEMRRVSQIGASAKQSAICSTSEKLKESQRNVVDVVGDGDEDGKETEAMMIRNTMCRKTWLVTTGLPFAVNAFYGIASRDATRSIHMPPRLSMVDAISYTDTELTTRSGIQNMSSLQ
jgi:hypothetical protein